MMEAFRLILHNSKSDVYEKFAMIIHELVAKRLYGQWRDLNFVISEHVLTEEEYFSSHQTKGRP